MDLGLIASRYASALFRFATEQGSADTVYGESVRLLDAFASVPGLWDAMADGVMVGEETRLALVRSALGGAVSPVMERFVRLLSAKGRTDCIRLIFQDYADLYYREKGILRVRLVTPRDPSPKLLSSLRSLIRKRTGREADIQVAVNPDLIGGFVLDLGDEILDASVASQLEKIRRTLTDKNRRIV